MQEEFSNKARALSDRHHTPSEFVNINNAKTGLMVDQKKMTIRSAQGIWLTRPTSKITDNPVGQIRNV